MNSPHLLRLAHPSALPIMRPREKRCPSRIGDSVTGRVVNLRRVRRCAGYGHHGGPAAVTRMRQMFRNWIIFFLPAVKASFAKEAGGIIGADRGRVEVESGLRKLRI